MIATNKEISSRIADDSKRSSAGMLSSFDGDGMESGCRSWTDSFFCLFRLLFCKMQCNKLGIPLLNHEVGRKLMSSLIPDAYKLLFKSTVFISRVGFALWAYMRQSVTVLFRGAKAQHKYSKCGHLCFTLYCICFLTRSRPALNSQKRLQDTNTL